MFSKVFNTLCETLPSYKRISERASRQTLEEIKDSLVLVEDDPGTNSRKISTQLAISQSRVVKTQRVQNLQPEDYALHMNIYR